jgi:hypothetical protein
MSARANLDTRISRPTAFLIALVTGTTALSCAPERGEIPPNTARIERKLQTNLTFDTDVMGGDGGSPSTQIADGIVYAFRGRSDGSFVNQIQLAYYVPSNPGVTNVYQTGDFFGTYPAVGGDGGTESGWIYCPSGQAAIGFFGRSGQGGPYVNQFRLACGAVFGLEEPNYDSQTATLGPDVGEFFNSGTCNNQGLMAMGYLSGAKVRTGSLLDQFIGVCRDAGF